MKAIRIFAVIGCAILALLAYGVYWAFYDLERIPKGDLLIESPSPDGRYTVRVYLSDAGATTSYSTVAELVDHQSQRTKNMYFQYKESEAVVEWLRHQWADPARAR